MKRASALLVVLLLAPGAALGGRLADELGRNEVRVWAAPFRLEPGVTVAGARLVERLERLGYERVRERPRAPGEFFWGHDRFWIFRREHRWDGRRRRAELIGLALERDGGRVLAVEPGVEASGDPEEPRRPRAPWLEPELLSESLDADRARRIPVTLDELPEHVADAVLAIEDARFFEHPGVDARAVARAVVRNARAGRVTQGGSTITQQLIKMRDLSPKRTLGRKASEAVRALALEAEYDKREILEAYLDAVYLGHVDGVEIRGYGAAARAFFSKPAAQLSLAEAALLAGMIQGPNRLHPVRHPRAALERQRRVLARMEELGWASGAELGRARRSLPPLRTRRPRGVGARHFLAWVGDEAERQAPRRRREGRGVVAETWLDPLLQREAEEAVRRGLERLRRSHPRLRSRPLSAALVAIDLDGGGVVALVGGDPAAGDDFDRARRARRQPGSAVKPLVLLEAFESCGDREALHPASLVSDSPLTIDLPTGPWQPQNSSGRFAGTVTLRRTLVDSLNVPLVRAARWCGFDATAARLRRAGYPLPEAPPPSFVLGSVEITPLELASAYTALAADGRALRPRPLRRLARPSGRTIERYGTRRRKVARPASAFLVRELLEEVVERGTAAGVDGFGKTGTSSDRRDAWFVGGAGRLVTAVWVGNDDGTPLGLSGAAAAAPLWREFMEAAASTRPSPSAAPPPAIVHRWVHAPTGLRVKGPRRDAYEEVFRRGAEPPRRRWYRTRRTAVIE